MNRNSEIFEAGKPYWGGRHLTDGAATAHFLVAGCTGSGKSVTIQLLMQSVLPMVESQTHSHRAVIYDSKQDLLPVLAGIIDPSHLVVLNPLQKFGSAWDIAADIDSPSVAFQLAEVLIPVEKNASQPFFSDAARHLLSGAFIALKHLRGDAWTLRDAILAVRSPDTLLRILSDCPHTEHLSVYFAEGKETASIMSTIATKMSRFEPIAAASERCQSKVSLKRWVTERSVLVLMNDDVTRAACDAFNMAIVQRLSQLLLGHPDHPSRRSWFFLDEVREAGKLEGLTSLLNRGRSKGVCVVLGFQDIEGLREVYGPHLANELIGQCGNKAVLRLQSPETAKWAEGLAGSYLREESSFSGGVSFGGGQKGGQDGAGKGASGRNLGTSQALHERKYAYDSEFLSLPFPNGEALEGFYFLRDEFGKWPLKPFRLLSKPRSDIPKSLRRTNYDDELLEPWSDQELASLSVGEQATLELIEATPATQEETNQFLTHLQDLHAR